MSLFTKKPHSGTQVNPNDYQNNIAAPEERLVVPAKLTDLGGDFFWTDKEYARDLQGEITEAVRKGTKSILNKHLYIGLHGADAWREVEEDEHYKIKQLAYYLLSDKKTRNLKSILEVIREDSGRIGVDIVSLGSGTGKDDILILDEVWNLYQDQVALFAIDLSSDLLRRAVTNILKHLDSNPEQRKKTCLHAICVDIDNLSLVKTELATHACHSNRFFHLLGLTLGNNKEYEFLSNISKAMEKGDYLLLGVDFCLNKNEWLAESMDSYRNTEQKILKFLSGPLITSLQVKKGKSGSGKLRFFGQMRKTPISEEDNDYYDYVNSGVKIDFKEVWDARSLGLSNVDGALSLARYYSDVEISKKGFSPEDAQQGGPIRLFDYSNKYSSDKFINFIQSTAGGTGLRLVEPNVMRWGKESQHLVLLKKDPEGIGILAQSAIPSLASMITDKLRNIEKLYKGTNMPDVVRRAQRMTPLFEISSSDNIDRIALKLKQGLLDLDVLTRAFSKEKDYRDALDAVEKLT